MKIGVCIKQVPSRESELAPGADGAWIGEADSYDSSEPDNYALEAGLEIKEAQGGEVVALLLGPAGASEVVKTALAKGADRAVHIENEADQKLDPLQVAAALAAVAKEEQFDLILTGLQSDDQGFGQTGVLLAELLGMSHSTVVVDIQLDGDRLEVRRELEGGWSQRAALPAPAVLTIQSGINKPRYATFKGIIAAKKKPIRNVDSAEVIPPDLAISQQILRLYVPTQDKQTVMLSGSPQEQAAGLVDKLKNEARVL
jgi:electron transfer flavoprotein beta subunit